MISFVIRAALWALASTLMLGTLLAVTLVNLPIMLFSLLFDRQHFNRLVQSYRSSYGSK